MDKERVLLLHVPYGNLYGGINVRKLGFGIPPLGLIALSAYLRKHAGLPVKLIDMLYHGVDINGIPGIIEEFSPTIVGLSASTPQMENAFAISRLIKKSYPRIKVVAGGAHASALPQRTLEEEPCIDYVVVGEGEIPFLSLVQGKPDDSIKSLAWRKNGQVVVNEREALIEDLGSLPFPDYAALPIERYGTLYRGRSMGIITGRGCMYNCSFCASGVTHLGRYRLRPLDILLDDIERLLRLGVARFDIWDDTFTALEERVAGFTEGYLARGLKADWSCCARADCLSRKMLKQMRAAGLDTLHIGCEAGNQEVLDRSNKGIKLEQVRQACRWCREEGISVYVYFILGLPYDTKETIRQTIDFAGSLPIDYAQFSMLVPLPGTKVWQMAQEGKVLRNKSASWADYDRYREAIVESDAVSARELTQSYRRALRSFYLRPAYLWKALKNIDSWEKLLIYSRLINTFLR